MLHLSELIDSMQMDINKYKVTEPIELQKRFLLKNHIEDAEKEIKERLRKKIANLQNTMYAEGKYSALDLFTRYGYFW